MGWPRRTWHKIARNTALDGLRGWAALVVCLYHFVWELFGAKFPEFRNIVTAPFCTGRLAVSVFFVLSGYVLTIGHWGDVPKLPIVKQLAKRYLRLTVPILGGTLVVLLVMWAGLTEHTKEAGAIVLRPDWLGNFLQFEVSVVGAAWFSLAWVYWIMVPVHLSYDPFLWTMPYEFFGSYLVLFVSLLEKRLLSAAGILGVIAGVMLMSGTWVAIAACFPLGALLAIVVQNGRLPRSASWWPVAVGLVAWIAGGYLELIAGPAWGVTLLAVVVVAVVATSDRIAGPLSSRLSSSLGRMSFSIYLMQFPVLVTLSATLIVGSGAGLNQLQALCIAAVSIVAVLVLAVPFQFFERLALASTAFVGRMFARSQPA